MRLGDHRLKVYEAMGLKELSTLETTAKSP
jgi:hypothetical protein